jgi:hypothetical protein
MEKTPKNAGRGERGEAGVVDKKKPTAVRVAGDVTWKWHSDGQSVAIGSAPKKLVAIRGART